MSRREFLHSTMADIRQRIEIYKEDKKNEARELEFKAWLNGLFVRSAIVSAFNKKGKYPDNPLNQEEPVNIEEMTEEQIIDAQEQALKKLDLMARMSLGIEDESQGE